MRPKPLAALLGLACLAGAALAQLPADNPDWKETDAPPPPAFRTDRLVTFETTTKATALSFGVDPATITISGDGVVRYVVVASSQSGAMNALYEGIRCTTAEFKSYARYHPDSGWTPVPNPSWRSLYDPLPSRHALAFARAGACSCKAPNRSVPDIVRDLKQPPGSRHD